MLERVGDDVLDGDRVVAQWHRGAWYVPRGDAMEVATPAEARGFARANTRWINTAAEEAKRRIALIDSLNVIRNLARTHGR